MVVRLSGHLAPGTRVELIGVVHSDIPVIPDPAFALVAAHQEQIRRRRIRLPAALEAAAQCIGWASPAVAVTWKILEGQPTDVILEEAERWNATGIVVGDTDRSALADAFVESMADAVAMRASIPSRLSPRDPGSPSCWAELRTVLTLERE